MRCCYQALYDDKDHLKSHFRLARCLHDLGWHNEAKECLDIFCDIYPDYASSHTCESLADDIDKTLAKLNKTDEVNKQKASRVAKSRTQVEDDETLSKCYRKEKYLQDNYVDYVKRFVGHCNVATDIKEANFIGTNFIGAGSDDGSFYIWGLAF
jgi:WD and tetratricopeptide repeat-containing protein 1